MTHSVSNPSHLNPSHLKLPTSMATQRKPVVDLGSHFICHIRVGVLAFGARVQRLQLGGGIGVSLGVGLGGASVCTLGVVAASCGHVAGVGE
jgi:hypothetical protein